MPVRLRLRRTGARKKPCYRIVAADGRCPRDGKFLEVIGYYDPRRQDEQVDLERADYWIGNGAQPSETVAAIIKRARDGKSFTAPKTCPPVAIEPPATPVDAPLKAEPTAEPAAEAAPEAAAEVAAEPAAEETAAAPEAAVEAPAEAPVEETAAAEPEAAEPAAADEPEKEKEPES